MAHSYTNGEGVSAQDRYRETKRDRQKGDADGDRSSWRKEWEPQLKKTRQLASLNFLGLACETSLSRLLLNLSTFESQAAAFPWAVLTKPRPSHSALEAREMGRTFRKQREGEIGTIISLEEKNLTSSG